MQTEQGGMQAVWPALGLALGSGMFLLALALKLPNAQEPVALVFNPTAPATATARHIAALDGRIVRLGGSDNIVIVRFDRAVTVRQLWRQGVWLSLDPVYLGGCFPSPSSAGNGTVS